MKYCSYIFLVWLAALSLSPAADLEPPTIPVGLDAYRQWECWPYQRIGARAYMRSTYDRTGGNAGPADAAHFLYQESKTFNVTLDVEGQGVLVFARYNHWHGSPWHYEVDGTDHIVQETSTADPRKPVPNSVFIPEQLFPSPLTWTWSTTKDADLMWVPIPFEKSFRMAYTRTFYGTGYYIYHQYVPGAKLSQPIRAWDGKTPPDPAVLDLLRRSWTDLAPETAARVSGRMDLPKSGSVKFATIPDGPAMIRALEFSVPTNQAVAFSRAMLRIAPGSALDALPRRHLSGRHARRPGARPTLRQRGPPTYGTPTGTSRGGSSTVWTPQSTRLSPAAAE